MHYDGDDTGGRHRGPLGGALGSGADFERQRDEARDQAAEQAKVPLDERIAAGESVPISELEHERGRAAARAPRRLRLNITQGPMLSPGYVVYSAFQSDNGVNWACAGTQITFSEVWFREVFGGHLEPSRRIEFEISNPHDVSD